MVIWRLKSGSDRRFRAGHPWVYSNELQESPKGISPGDSVELRDASGKFLARGYGNPHSLIAFRTVSRNEMNLDPFSETALRAQVLGAAQLRRSLGFETSFRLFFGEADGFPGLVIDRYLLDGPNTLRNQVFAIQAHAAGADRVLALLPQVLSWVSSEMKWPEVSKTALIIRNDLNVRKLEGIPLEEPRLLQGSGGLDLTSATILTGSSSKPDKFTLDLMGGQKTGFFLDQYANVSAAQVLAEKYFEQQKPLPSTIRILDLCCYVGQWSTRLAKTLKESQPSLKVEVTAVDASASALQFAQMNVERTGAQFKALKGDVLKDLKDLADDSFHIVVCDPPALIKSRKDIPAGTHAYLQLNTEALRIVKTDGIFVSCSCSALLEEEEFRNMLAKAIGRAKQRSGKRVSWVSRGMQSPDHPLIAEFPEGKYLKSWLGLVQKDF